MGWSGDGLGNNWSVFPNAVLSFATLRSVRPLLTDSIQKLRMYILAGLPK
jgi:hypothetical protein